MNNKNKKKFRKILDAKYRKLLRDRDRLLKIRSYINSIQQILKRIK